MRYRGASGGTSKGAGDLSHRIVSVLVRRRHRAWRRAQARQAAVSRRRAMQADHRSAGVSDLRALHVPCVRRARDPRQGGPTAGSRRERGAAVPVRIPSELGRKEFVLVALVAGEAGPIAFPIGKGSGSVTTFSQADGFLEVGALRTSVDPGTHAQVTLIGAGASAGPGDRGQSLRCARRRSLRAFGAGNYGAHDRHRQHGRRRGRAGGECDLARFI